MHHHSGGGRSGPWTKYDTIMAVVFGSAIAGIFGFFIWLVFWMPK